MPIYRVLIVDDSAFMRKVFSDRISADDDFTVAATASDGEEAVALALSLEPDIITMDLEMPRLNGIEALRRIMSVRPTPVIILSAITDNGTRDTIRALQYGAFDFIHKPDSSVKHDIRQVGDELLEKLRIAIESVKKGTLRMLPAVEDGIVEYRALPQDSPGGKPEPPEPPVSAHSTPEVKRSVLSDVVPTQNTLIPRYPAIESSRTAVTPERLKPAIKPKLTGPPAKPSKATAAGPTIRPQGASPPQSRPPIRSAAAEDTVPAPPAGRVKQAAKLPSPPEERRPFKPSPIFSSIVAIGTSTGGPRALHEVLTGLPADLEAPVLVVQHMPPRFTFSLAQRLDSFCAIHVREAAEGDQVETATAYIAPGGKHMTLMEEPSGTYRIKLTEEGPRSGHMPSVDVLFESLVGHRQLKRHAVLMTGMGSDGAKGMKSLQEDGVETRIAEAEETCVVYGMPRSAVEIGAVSHQLPLQRIAPFLVREVNPAARDRPAVEEPTRRCPASGGNESVFVDIHRRG